MVVVVAVVEMVVAVVSFAVPLGSFVLFCFVCFFHAKYGSRTLMRKARKIVLLVQLYECWFNWYKIDSISCPFPSASLPHPTDTR